MLRVHTISDHCMHASLLAIGRPLPGWPVMPGSGTIEPHPSDTPGLVPDIGSPMPRTDTPGLPGNLPSPGPAFPDTGAPAHEDDPATRPDRPDPGDVPDPGAPLPGGGVTVPEEEIPERPHRDPDYPTAIPVPT